MDRLKKPQREERQEKARENPSFSSTLLDAIYRSIDQEQENPLIFYSETMRRQKEALGSLRGENCGDKKANVLRRNSLTEFDRRTRSNFNSMSMNSCSSSSFDSSCGGGFSSSESDSFNNISIQRPKPIRTSVSSSSRSEKFETSRGYNHKNHSAQTQKPKHENGFMKTKSKALRILYGDLKKAKQPISPGNRISSFLNSLFTVVGNTKKAKISSPCSLGLGGYDPKSAQASSACSSASSFSRSCLSKTPSSRSGAKRSVRFCPVSVIVDEDCRPCGHKNLHEDETGLRSYDKNNNEELKLRVMQESRRVEDIARDLLKNYQKKIEDHKHFGIPSEDEDDEEDDDVGSCASSDLFELDNLSVIGIERYREELPVYETTHLNTNRAIANGLFL